MATEVPVVQSLVGMLANRIKKMNRKKTKVMVFKHGIVQVNPVILVFGEQLESVSEFVYLTTLLTSNNDCTPEMKQRINLASQTIGIFKSLWASSQLSTKTKFDFMTLSLLTAGPLRWGWLTKRDFLPLK